MTKKPKNIQLSNYISDSHRRILQKPNHRGQNRWEREQAVNITSDTSEHWAYAYWSWSKAAFIVP